MKEKISCIDQNTTCNGVLWRICFTIQTVSALQRIQGVDWYTNMQMCLSDIIWRHHSDSSTIYQMEPILKDGLWS